MSFTCITIGLVARNIVVLVRFNLVPADSKRAVRLAKIRCRLNAILYVRTTREKGGSTKIGERSKLCSRVNENADDTDRQMPFGRV